MTCWLRHSWKYLLLALGLFLASVPAAQQSRPVVYVATIEGIIDLGLVPYLQRVLDAAASEKAAAVILNINTFGGRVDAAVQIRDALLNSPVRTIAFVNKRAISAGALISLASENIAMARGGTIGAATPVELGQPGAGASAVGEKTVSYVRKEFRATAESRKRPPLLAEAMVDADVAIPGVIEKGKLLTLTTEEALRLKLADYPAETIEEVLQRAGLGGAELRRDSPNWAERVVRVLTHPVVSSLLMTVAMLGIILELRTPGFGVPGIIGIAGLGLFLWGHWLAQLAGWEEVILAVVGVALLALEFLVIPGFGVAGVLGIAALLAGLVMSMTGQGSTAEFMAAITGRVMLSVLFALVASFVLLRFMTRLPAGRRLILETDLSAAHGYASPPEREAQWLEKRGVAASVLRPAGIAEIDNSRVDVVSDGELIEPGEAIEVIRVDGNRVVVRRVGKH